MFWWKNFLCVPANTAVDHRDRDRANGIKAMQMGNIIYFTLTSAQRNSIKLPHLCLWHQSILCRKYKSAKWERNSNSKRKRMKLTKWQNQVSLNAEPKTANNRNDGEKLSFSSFFFLSISFRQFYKIVIVRHLYS